MWVTGSTHPGGHAERRPGAGRTLSGWLDLKGLQAVMYRAGTHTSSAEDLNAGEHKARPSVKNEWLHVETTLDYLMQAPHPTGM